MDSTTSRLTTALNAYYHGNEAEAQKTFSQVMSAHPDVAGRIYHAMYVIKGSADISHVGQFSFEQKEGFRSTIDERALAINHYLVAETSAPLSNPWLRDRYADHAMRVTVQYPIKIDASRIVHVGRSWTGADKVWETSGRSSTYYWKADPARTSHVISTFDPRDEVATPDCPAQHSTNSTAWRALSGEDYAAAGFIKIGRVWVDRTNKKDVGTATERFHRENKTPVEYVSGAISGVFKSLAACVDPVHKGTDRWHETVRISSLSTPSDEIIPPHRWLAERLADGSRWWGHLGDAPRAKRDATIAAVLS
ncbi:MAG: hypothetical protein HY860_05020 [Chlamydiales bacterium]|nr:hypothetical protein [Chlamydiales bacterium]